ncbi:Pollen Ole e 1 allergen and extensin family protein [Hibiscus syriacus]|uniref:Pollen Ole e 1 allergen and extensin family protein n=1 Tax=Hibiscus syriacus TaxID=106335 RepID=A0A6A2WYZ4_HIBSY|nr:Pollen Ole e 1 allergen and extensin family protein [Hibiscus syriacus]
MAVHSFERISSLFLFFILSSIFSFGASTRTITNYTFSIGEATVKDIKQSIERNQLTSRQLVEFYLGEISRLNGLLKGVIEVNPDALLQADAADKERKCKLPGSLPDLHGIPILLKDTIATKDKLNTTAGSFALLGSVVPRDAGVVNKLRQAGAIILGKASLSEWADFRSINAPAGFSPRSGQGKNPYVLSATPCGSSSGPAISVAANLVTVSLGTETDGSILCPASFNSVVGLKPTVGLTSRAGVIPVTPRQDTIGPICRTVSDAVYVLDAIAGFDSNDEATRPASYYIPPGGYKRFLNPYGLQGKRLGVVRDPFFKTIGLGLVQTFESHFETLRRLGAIVVDNLQIYNIDVILNVTASGEAAATIAEFKLSLNAYLEDLEVSPVRSLADIITFNLKFPDLVGPGNLLGSRSHKWDWCTGEGSIIKLGNLSKNGLEKLMRDNELDAVVTPRSDASAVYAIGGFPAIIVPAGYDSQGLPFGILFGGLKGSESKLIEIAYAFEQATMIRKPPSFKP